jgi:hypothetical protein
MASEGVDDLWSRAGTTGGSWSQMGQAKTARTSRSATGGNPCAYAPVEASSSLSWRRERSRRRRPPPGTGYSGATPIASTSWAPTALATGRQRVADLPEGVQLGRVKAEPVREECSRAASRGEVALSDRRGESLRGPIPWPKRFMEKACKIASSGGILCPAARSARDQRDSRGLRGEGTHEHRPDLSRG